MLITHKIQIDIQAPESPPRINVVCGDAYTRKLELTLFSGGAEWPVPDGVSAVVRYSRSDGYGGLYDRLLDGKAACSIDKNVVTAILAPQVLSAPGFAKVSVALVKDEQILGLFPVGINVKADPSQNVIPAENYYNYPTIGDINKAITDLESRMDAMEQDGTGISNEEKKVILALFKNIAYTADMSAKIAELEALWSVSYKVAYSLTGVASSNDAARVAEGGTYTTTLTAEGGYSMTGATVKVTMGGADITSTAYSGGVITIESVTGPVAISAVAKEIPSYSVTNNLTGVANSNTDTKVAEGGSYMATLTIDEGYVLSRLVITMGGVDITADVYGEGYILIAEVTGDVVITAVAEEPVPIDMIDEKNCSSVRFYTEGENSTQLVSKSYANIHMSKRITRTDAEVSITFANNTDAAITIDAYAGSAKTDYTEVGYTPFGNKVYYANAYYSATLVKGLSIAPKTSVTYKYTVKAGYHLAVFKSSNDIDMAVSGGFDLEDMTTEYALVSATGTAWAFYSGDTVDDAEKVDSMYDFNVYYKIEEPFAEDTTLRIIAYNFGVVDNPAWGKVVASRYDGVTAKAAFDTLKCPTDFTIAEGVEAFEFEYFIPAGNTFICRVPTGCLVIKKVS